MYIYTYLFRYSVIHIIIDSYRFSTFKRAKNWKCRIQNPEESTRCFELLLFPSKFYWKSMESHHFPHDFPMISSFRPERFPVALCGTWNVSMVPIGMSRCGRTTMPRSMGRALNPWRSPEGNGVRAQRRVLLPSKHGSLPSDIWYLLWKMTIFNG